MERAISAVRNTCFAILSAVETDVRDTVALACLEGNSASFLPEDIRQRAFTRFHQDSASDALLTETPDYDLLAYADFGDLAKILYSTKTFIETTSGVSVDIVAPKLEALARARNRVCHSRPLEEEDLPSFLDLGKFLLQHASTWNWGELEAVQKRMDEDPSYVLRLQIPEFWRLERGTVPNNLPLPDYDETTFLGRITERKELKRHLLGRHPVVTLVGEGGVGKTALALQCVYDLLDLGEECPYEAIVWVTLKNKVLTASGIASVQGAVADVLGILQVSATQLGAAGQKLQVHDAANELIAYLREIKALLIIDNFETLTSNPLRDFFTEIPEGSKILITSRVGLGELELRYSLDPLDMKTASNLLRKYARAFNLHLLSDAPNAKIERYVKFLFGSPLLIKWFVQSVASGADPERITGKTNQNFASAIRFCFENLFERLTPTEREVLHILSAARKQLTFTELMFLIQDVSKRSPLDVESALTTLHSSSMVKRTAPDSRSSDVSTRLNLTEIATEYLGKFAPPSTSTMSKVQAALKKLRETTELSSVQKLIYKYDITAVRAETKDERICAVYLNQALSFTKVHRYDDAAESIAKVLTLLPSYSEAYRISSFQAAAKGDLYKAAEELDKALEYSPKSALIYYQYAQLALYKLDDPGLALEMTDRAIEIDRQEEALHTLRALALVRVGRCIEAAEIYETQLVNLDSRQRKWRITTRDQSSECYRRLAERDIKMKENDLAKTHLGRALEILEGAIAHGDFDERMGRLYVNVVEDALFFARTNSDHEYASDVLKRYNDAGKAAAIPSFRRFSLESMSQSLGQDPWICNAVAEALGTPSLNRSTGVQSLAGADFQTNHQGRVKAPFSQASQQFGFIASHGQDWFFHRTDLITAAEWPRLAAGCLVNFDEGRDATGRVKAIRVSIDK
jgi:LuxR family glucitol operon transcriptional activator